MQPYCCNCTSSFLLRTVRLYELKRKFSRPDCVRWKSIVHKVIHGRPRYLEHREIPRNIDIFNNAFQLEVYSELFFGVVGQQGNLSAQSYSIQLAIDNAFQMSNFHIFTAGGTTISIFANENNINLFDSHARDSLGNVS